MRILSVVLMVLALAGCGSEQQVASCAAAIGAFDDKASAEKCDGLTPADQKKAAELATKANGVIVFLPPYVAKKAREEALARGEVLEQPKTFEGVRDLAFKGNYQAQRNLAFGYSSHPYQGQDKNPILACAWRIVIIKSGSEKVDETDVGNHQVYCEKLEKVSRDAAEAQAEQLLKKIKH